MPTSDANETNTGLPRLIVQRQERPWLRRILFFAACVLLADALFGDWGLAETLRARREYDAALGRLSAIQAENAALQDQIRRLLADPRTIETAAREDLGLLLPGEILVVVSNVH